MTYAAAHWNIIAWVVALCACVLLEIDGLIHPKTDQTFSGLVRRTIPVWARAAIIGWLCYHFVVQH